ncbi:MAG: inositol monophosphatase family protein, partial [Gammaproteobacteria bacterium]|nr:inositol monophosphatase family protein [Gammaproteobacteria bacterium]
CLDPLDGTSNFAAGIPYFAASLALIREGRVVLGLVYDPVRDECFSAIRGEGVWLNDAPLLPAGNLPIQPGIGIVDFKRLPAELAARLAVSPPFKSQRSFGSVALDWCWLAAGRGHVYLHGRQNLWDYAAGNLIFEQAGGYACTLEGEPVFDLSLRPRSAVAALDQTFFTNWCDWLLIKPCSM